MGKGIWIIPIFLFIMVVLAAIPYIDRAIKRRRFSNGVLGHPGDPCYYFTPASKEQVIASFSERSESDIYVSSFSSENRVNTLVLYRVRGKLQKMRPSKYYIDFLSEHDGCTAFSVTADPGPDVYRYYADMNEFFAAKVNATRFDPENDNI